MQTLSRSANMAALHQLMLKRPVFTVREVAENLGVSRPTANNLVNALAEEGIIADITGKKSGRQWAYVGLIEILAEGTKGLPS